MTHYKPGSWNVVCAVCGVQFKSDEIMKRWDGLLVCKDDFEVRHIADFLRPTVERGIVPFVNADPPDQFIYVCYLEQSQGRAGVGESDCARADITLSMFIY